MSRSGATSRVLGLYTGSFVVFLYAPVLLLPLFSFSASPYAALPITGPTLHWYAQLLHDPAVGAALGASLGVALCAAPVASLAGLLAAHALVRRRGIAAGPVAALSLAPLLIPGVVLGVAMLMTAQLAGVAPSLPLVAAGHVVLCLPLCLIVLRNHFRSTPRTVEEAALDLGATPLQVMLRVVLPMAAPSLLACLVLSFTTSMDEFVVSFFLAGSRQTLPIFIWNHLRFPADLPRMMALGTILLIVSSLLALAGGRLAFGSLRRA
jgi:spermidine/putrescine transport system permease protein